MFCQECGLGNSLQSKYCVGCGTILQHIATDIAPPPPPLRQSIGAAMKEKQITTKKELYATVVGTKNQYYYLQKFQEFDRAGGAGFSWHWPSFFVSFYWLLYRKMWGKAAWYFVLPYLIGLVAGFIAMVINDRSGGLVSFVSFIYFIGIWVVPPLYANAWYYTHCQKLIADSHIQTRDPERQLGILEAKGGTSSIALILIMIFGGIFTLSIMAAISIPAYQDYVDRSKVVQAINIGKQATESVDRYYLAHDQLPDSLLSTDFTAMIPQSIQNVDLNSQSGVISIRLNNTNNREQKVIFSPDHVGLAMAWQCSAIGLKPRSLPDTCQATKAE